MKSYVGLLLLVTDFPLTTMFLYVVFVYVYTRVCVLIWSFILLVKGLN